MYIYIHMYISEYDQVINERDTLGINIYTCIYICIYMYDVMHTYEYIYIHIYI
jgi:hypothetical protein